MDTILNNIFGWDSFLSQAERDVGVGISIIQGNLYRNLSSLVNEMLTSNANEARARREGRLYVNVRGVYIFYYLTPGDYLWILENVNAGDRWDFKDYYSWADQFPNVPYHGVDDLFVVNGVRMGSADLGNLNFGYVMSALKVHTLVQLAGAGLAHISHHGIRNQLQNPRYILNFGDSDRCRLFTDLGRYWYANGRPIAKEV